MSQEVQLVLAKCSNCSTNTTAPSGYKGLVFCSELCRTAYTESKRVEYLDAEAAKFLAKCPDYYPCAHNQRVMADFLAHLELEQSAENLSGAFVHLTKAGKLLGKLTRRDIDLMPSPEYDARERIDPQLGSVLAEVEASGNAKFAPPQSYKTGGVNWQTFQKANLQDRQRHADERAMNRRRS